MKKLFTFVAIAASLSVIFYSCDKDNNGKDNKQKDNGKTTEAIITIDGDFTDWANMDPAKYAIAKNNANSPWDAVREIRCCADADFVYYYIKFDQDVLDELSTSPTETLPIRLCINTDNEFTSGYASYFLQSYDFIIEGGLFADGKWDKYDGEFHQRTYVESAGKETWLSLLKPNNNLVMGMGAKNEYEILLSRDIFNNAVQSSPDPKPMGDVFQTGIRFYTTGVADEGHPNGKWDELSNMPNSSIDDGDGNGWGNLMEVTTIK